MTEWITRSAWHLAGSYATAVGLATAFAGLGLAVLNATQGALSLWFVVLGPGMGLVWLIEFGWTHPVGLATGAGLALCGLAWGFAFRLGGGAGLAIGALGLAMWLLTGLWIYAMSFA